jgi:hypothetical protein
MQITITNAKPCTIKWIFLRADLGVDSDRNKKQCKIGGRSKYIQVKQ